MVVLGEFILLWVILGSVVNGPIISITEAMSRLEKGDPSARTDVHSRTELGIIANRFNLMAAELERAAEERESLIAEIQGLNAGLQSRIQEALAALQGKNQELEKLMEGNALLREELAQQERLAVAGQLTAAFAHEVGTPLNLVNSHLQLLQGQSELNDKTRERLGVIQRPDPAGGGHRAQDDGPDPAAPLQPGAGAPGRPGGGPAAPVGPHPGHPRHQLRPGRCPNPASCTWIASRWNSSSSTW